MKWAPHQLSAMIQALTTRFMTGWFRAIRLSALTFKVNRDRAARSNLPISWCSRTNALTTRMALTFSCTTPFRSSYRLKISLNNRATRVISTARNVERTTIATRNTRLSFPLMKKHMNKAETMLSGARNDVRSSIWNAFWMLLTSVVMRVTSPAVLNLSISEKEKRWIFRYMASRRFAASPVLE